MHWDRHTQNRGTSAEKRLSENNKAPALRNFSSLLTGSVFVGCMSVIDHWSVSACRGVCQPWYFTRLIFVYRFTLLVGVWGFFFTKKEEVKNLHLS